MGDIKVKGPYAADALDRIVRNQAEPIRWCVGEDAAAGAVIEEKIALWFEIVPNNAKLQGVKVESRELSDGVEACIVRRFEATRFPVVSVDGVTRVKADIQITTR